MDMEDGEKNHLDMYHSIQASCDLLSSIGDISLSPNIDKKKAKKAIKTYVENNYITPEEVLLFVDNTIFRSGKQGMMITDKMLYSFSNISGKFSISLDSIRCISPQVRYALKNAQLGLVINNRHFVSLPGFTGESLILRDYIEWQGFSLIGKITTDLMYFSIFLSQSINCNLILDKEPDPGPPPWYSN